jgi:hypothetical protein
MKRTLYLIILLLSVTAVARQYKLIESRHIADNSKDCRKIGNCISARYLKNDTLHLTIYADNQFRDINLYRDSFTLNQDTLCLERNDTTPPVYSYVFNKVKNKVDTFFTRSFMIVDRMDDGYDTRRNEYTLTGFQRIPAVIRFENVPVCDCPTRPIEFDIYNNDTINVINANGLKQGVWVSFFDTCEKEMEMYYDKGVFTGGKLFDKKGNDRHATFHYGEMMEIGVNDSLQEK